MDGGETEAIGELGWSGGSGSSRTHVLSTRRTSEPRPDPVAPVVSVGNHGSLKFLQKIRGF